MLNIHIYPSYLTNESRILREAEAIFDQKLSRRIIILGIWKAGLKPDEFVTDQISIKRLRSIAKSNSSKWLNIPAFILFYLNALHFCAKQKPQIINAHSLTVLPLATAIKWVTGAKLIYDPHELETETNGSSGYRKKLEKIVEKNLIRFADHTIVVGHHIRDWYKGAYNLVNIDVIRNIPKNPCLSLSSSDVLHETFGIGHDKIIYLYLGALMRGRGIEIILDSFKLAGDPYHVVFVGFGEYEQLLLEESMRAENIHFLHGVNPDKVLQITSGADVGISLIENTSLSYYYCLPNKVFEYLLAGIPFIASDFPELRREFGHQEFCWLIYPDKEALLEIIRSISHDQIAKRKSQALDRRMNWSWENEKMKYKSIYNRLNSR